MRTGEHNRERQTRHRKHLRNKVRVEHNPEEVTGWVGGRVHQPTALINAVNSWQQRQKVTFFLLVNTLLNVA